MQQQLVVKKAAPSPGELFTIKSCFSCANAVQDPLQVKAVLEAVFKGHDFSRRLAARLNGAQPLHHQMFHLAVAGCPNSCSQPQIKDFGLQGQVVPEVAGACLFCGRCTAACPDGAITLGEDGPVIAREQCLNCGQCIRVCPNGTLAAGRKGFRVLVGGKLGRHPRLARVLLPLAGEGEVARVLGNCLELFLERGRPGERFGTLLDRVGIETLLQ